MSTALWSQPSLMMSAEFGLSGISLGIYDPSPTLLATLNGPLVELAGTHPLTLVDSARQPILLLNLVANRMAGRHFGRILTVAWPDGSPAGTVYLHTLARAVTYGIFDDATQSDVGWLVSDPHLQQFQLQNATGAPVGGQQIATQQLHALSSSKQAWWTWLAPGLQAPLAPLALAAMTFPPTLLRDTLAH